MNRLKYDELEKTLRELEKQQQKDENKRLTDQIKVQKKADRWSSEWGIGKENEICKTNLLWIGTVVEISVNKRVKSDLSFR